MKRIILSILIVLLLTSSYEAWNVDASPPQPEAMKFATIGDTVADGKWQYMVRWASADLKETGDRQTGNLVIFSSLEANEISYILQVGVTIKNLQKQKANFRLKDVTIETDGFSRTPEGYQDFTNNIKRPFYPDPERDLQLTLSAEGEGIYNFSFIALRKHSHVFLRFLNLDGLVKSQHHPSTGSG